MKTAASNQVLYRQCRRGDPSIRRKKWPPRFWLRVVIEQLAKAGLVVSGTSPDERLVEARELVEIVHREGRKIRFWGTPDRERVWASLIAIGVDYVGTDDATRLQRMLRGR